MNYYKMKKFISFILVLSVMWQNFLFFQNSAFADNNKVSNNYISSSIEEKADIISKQIKSQKGLLNAKIDFDKNANIKSIKNINYISSWDYKNDLQNILWNINNGFTAKNNVTDFNIISELKDKKTQNKHIRLWQVYNWIPVFWKQTVIHTDNNNSIKSLSIELSQDMDINTTPTLTKNEAIEIWKQYLTKSTEIEIQNIPSLMIYPIDDYSNLLVYHFELISKNIATEKKERWEFFIDAHKWRIIKSFNKILDIIPSVDWYLTTISWSLMSWEWWNTVSFTWWKDNTNSGYFLRDNTQKYIIFNKSTNTWTYNDANSFAYKNTSAWDTLDSIAISAANNISTTLRYFKENYNFTPDNLLSLSWGMLYTFIHEDMDNAYWDWRDIVIWDWDWITDWSLATLDIIWHEFAHAWTEYTSNLVYYWEQWALNESFSDIMWTNIEFYWQQDWTAVYPNKLSWKSDWLIWEDCAYSWAFRDMKNPHNFDQPSRYMWTDWYFWASDNWWVHYNSSIQNYFYYLLVNWWSGNNDWINYSVNWVWLSQASNLAYNANTYYMMQNYNYAQARLAWIDAADDLDVTGNLSNSVRQAWDAVWVESDNINEYPNIIDYKFTNWDKLATDFTLSWSSVWSFDGSTWALDSWSIVSWIIWNNQATQLSWSWLTNSWFIGFRYKTSSETYYDELNFYVDWALLAARSWNSPWLFHSQMVSSGYHQFTWEYKKDVLGSGLLDKVWIDDITLPVWASWSFIINTSPSVISNNSNYYTSWSSISLLLNSNKIGSTMIFSWIDFSAGSHTFTSLTWTTNLNIISSWTWVKNISANLADKLWNTQLLSWSVIFDNEWPTAPIFSWWILYNSWNINLIWWDSIDNLVWNANRYYYELSNTYNSYTNSWIVTWTWLKKTWLWDWDYSFLIQWYDLLWNTWVIATWSFVVDWWTPTASWIFLSWSYTNSATNNLKLISSEQINYNITSTGITNAISWITSSWITYLPITLSWSDGVKVLNIDFSDSAGNTWVISSSITLDTTAPSYMLNIHNSQLTQWPSFTLSGTVSDNYSWVWSVSINWVNLSWSLANWTKDVNLNAGTNLFNFVFTDNLWNSSGTGMNVIRTSIPSNIWSIVNSTWSVSINFDTDISATGRIIYWTTSNNLSNYVDWNSFTTSHSINLSGLDSNSTYYFKAFWKNLWFTWQLSNIYSFNTPQILVDATWSQVATWSVIISWASSTWIVFSSSTWSAIIFSNNWNDSIILNLSWLSITASWTSWNWILQWPEIYATWLILNSTWYTRVGNYYEIGNYNSSLVLSWNVANISIDIGSDYNWKILRVYRSEDRQNFSSFTTCLVTAGICQFSTDHFSLFAFWEPSDSTPDPFNFIPITLAELWQEYTSNTITLTWTNTSVPITISWWAYKINNWTYTSASWTVNSWDQIVIKLTSSSNYSTVMTSTLTIWWVSANYTITTKTTSSWGWGWWGWGGYSSTKVTIVGSWITNSWTLSTTTAATSIKKKNIKTVKITFSDISYSFAKDDINNLVSKWIIKWFSDGTFKPDNNSTRAEFLAIAMKAFNIDLTSESVNPFMDIDNSVSWISPYVIKAKELWIVSWQMKQRKWIFRPNDPITRAEALVILFKIAKIDTKSTKKLEFKDEFASWMLPYVIKAKELWIVSWQTKDWKLIFRPNDPITRAESVRIITKTLWLSN